MGIIVVNYYITMQHAKVKSTKSGEICPKALTDTLFGQLPRARTGQKYK